MSLDPEEEYGTWDMLDHLSHSSLSMLARCPYAWMQRYLMGISSPPSGAMHLGTAAHAALEAANQRYLAAGEFLTPEAAHDVFRMAWEEGEARFARLGAPMEWRNEHAPTVQEQGRRLIALYLQRPFVPAAVEETIVRPIQEIYGTKYIKNFVARIDLRTVDNQIGDFKFTTKKKSQGEVDLDLQPFAYAFALDRPIDFCFIQMCRSKTDVKDPFSNLRREDAWTRRDANDIGWYMEQFIPGLLLTVETAHDIIYSDWGNDLSWRNDKDTVQAVQRLFPAVPNWACNSFCSYRREDMCRLRLKTG